MNKQDEEKVKEILNKHFGHPVKEGSDEWYTLNYQNRFRDLQDMASWKEQQMIERFEEFLKSHDYKYYFPSLIIEDLKKATEGE